MEMWRMEWVGGGASVARWIDPEDKK
ncbi:hypothetical protein LCGC14_1789290, partial [marine sediment metagenome]